MENKDKETGIMPGYSESNIRITERVQPDGIRVSLYIEDIPSFVEEISTLRPEGYKSFVKYGERNVEINIVNLDFRIKKL